MGASRKLQGEIDRVLKKVYEGVEVFVDSVCDAPESNRIVTPRSRLAHDASGMTRLIARPGMTRLVAPLSRLFDSVGNVSESTRLATPRSLRRSKVTLSVMRPSRLRLTRSVTRRSSVDSVGNVSESTRLATPRSLRRSKVHDTDNANQKEKYEVDLKKEIKKLQRYRDQIKTWLQSSEIKDKKVSASYEQALIDARRCIEKEMERFKICEKEMKTKAFSKEGLEQQPKTDPKEKAKSKTRDWLNNTVSELESQIDSFEAEIEGLSVKKGKTRPPRLIHLESSINRHKAHIMKLELILRLLDNDELSPEEVNDVKDFVDDYVERNQEDFDEFDDVDMLYNTLPLDKVESLEDLVTIGTPTPVKGVALSIKSGLSTSLALSPAAVASSHHQHGDSIQKQVAEKAPQESISEFGGRNTPSKISAVASAPPTPAGTHATPVAIVASSVHSGPSSAKSVLDNSTSSVPSLPMNNAVKGVLDSSISSVPSLPMNNALKGVLDNSTSSVPSLPMNNAVKGVLDNSTSSVPSLPMNNVVKEEDNSNFPGRKPSPALPEAGLMNLGRSAANPPSITIPSTSGSIVSSNGSLGVASETPRRAMLGADDRLGGSGIVRPLVSSSSIRMMLPQAVKTSEAVSGGNGETGGVPLRTEIAPDHREQFLQRYQQAQQQGLNLKLFTTQQNPLQPVPLRTEIAPDHREQFLQRYQQAQQQGLNLKLFTTQQNPLQPFNSRSSTPSPQGGLIGGLAPGLINVTSAQQHPSSIHSQSGQRTLMATGSKDTEVGHVKADAPQQHQSITDDSATSSVLHKYTANEGDSKVSNTSVTQAGVSGSVTEPAQVTHDIDVSPHQSSQSTQTASLGVIGRRSVPDLGAIWDSLSGLATLETSYDPQATMQLLESSFHKLPQPKDSERANYTPRHPTVTPKSYPQVQAPIVSNPTFWERLGSDNVGTDTLFFAFYCQQNTYQQYLAAKELKKQSWRYHKEYNTWFQRHEEPKVSTDDFEQGTYVYFDFHMGNDEMQNGWCQRIKTDFKFEYQFLEDELVV
ncbi:CCR4-NOT transcription complex subunit 3 [Artemisia annua]|uniref:CCR4-NOT transcription complex subunit 3 n=1 Tax=Artemisia annua TaxID=35608 RepID=A0A2U1Q375_ARTAN|nr:CCR4-NOT transcription complex subunit 3 [Artemisia annua]